MASGQVLKLLTLTLTLTLALAAISLPASAECERTTPEPGTQQLFSDAWGTGYASQRFQSASRTSINADNAASLELAWVYGFSTDQPRSYPLVTEDTIFIGDGDRGLVALDRETGCLRWENTSVPDIATAILPAHIEGRLVLVFAEREDGVHAVDALSGEILWTQTLEDMAEPMFSGSPLVFDDTVYVPLSSREIGLALNPLFGCCRTSGGVVALDVRSGKQRWFRPTIDNPGSEESTRLLVAKKYGPSGAPVWGSPTLDTEHRRLYFGTGQNYSYPTTLTSDAIFAVNSDSGEIDWVRQFTANDAYNLSCGISESHPNCPNPVGPDVDFGAPPILYTQADGKRVLLAGQKSGDVYALDAVTGDTLWTRRIGRGGKLGGIHWGMALDPQSGQLFVPVSDIGGHASQQRQPGVFALDITDGSIRWSTQRDSRCEDKNCWTGISAAISAGPGIVVSGGLDGVLEITRTSDGKTLWSYESMKSFTAVNAVETKGGVFDAHGPMLAGDQLIVSSGYGSFFQEGGNALLVFALPKQ